VSRPTSLRRQLLWWLLVPLGALSLFGAVAAYFTVSDAIDAAYDRPLAAAALEISEHLRMIGTRPAVDLPPVALEMLDTIDQDRLFYSLSWRSQQGEQFMTGYDDLPRPQDAAAGKTIFYDAQYRGERVRIAAHFTAMPATPPVMVVTQVAETVGGRVGQVHAILASALGLQALLLCLGAGLVWMGVTRGLRPLREVSAEVARRTASDLAPLSSRSVPKEISPLVVAVDQLMARVREAIALQRRFIADASHQLRTPLTVLRAHAESALREQDPAAMRAALAQLRDHSQATSRLATQLLSLARAEPTSEVRSELLDLAGLARETCAMLVPEALARGADLGFEERGTVPIHAEPLLIRELIANLVDNSIRYAPHATITVGVRNDAGHGILWVEDDGPGIPADERGRVFERFYRVRGTPGDGAGLGLSIVREITQRYGGTVELRNGAGGKGLCVEVRFPPAGEAYIASTG
jgi:two-component system sensor histidine kinase TctE